MRRLRALPQYWSRQAKFDHLKKLVEKKTKMVVPTNQVEKVIAFTERLSDQSTKAS